MTMEDVPYSRSDSMAPIARESSPPTTTVDLLRCAPEEASRRICLSFLDEGREALARVDDPEDAEALHDFRVALRRLRSATRAWSEPLKGAVRKKDVKLMRSLQQSTNRGRDAEVLIEWLLPQRRHLHWSHRVGYDWLHDHLKARKEQVYATARATLRKDFETLERRLRPRLEVMTLEVPLFEARRPFSFGQAIGASLRVHVAEAQELLVRVSGPSEAEVAHEARIAIKRLRYLIEPLRRTVPAVRERIELCKELQDILGGIQDTYVLLEELSVAVESAAAQRARRLHTLMKRAEESALRREQRRSEHSGLLELARRARRQLDELFRKFQEWRERELESFVASMNELAHEFDRSTDFEIERKYLLSAVPEAVLPSSAIEIDQGYLPGKVLQERLRRTVRAGEIAYTRTVKHGMGMSRLELEETASEEVFRAMWPLTEGRRVCKKRYKIPTGELVWEIDVFTDRDLVLAEVELASEADEPEMPEWLRSCLVREVTDESEYLNINLAR